MVLCLFTVTPSLKAPFGCFFLLFHGFLFILLTPFHHQLSSIRTTDIPFEMDNAIHFHYPRLVLAFSSTDFI
jgi:hypothetical protein